MVLLVIDCSATLAEQGKARSSHPACPTGFAAGRGRVLGFCDGSESYVDRLVIKLTSGMNSEITIKPTAPPRKTISKGSNKLIKLSVNTRDFFVVRVGDLVQHRIQFARFLTDVHHVDDQIVGDAAVHPHEVDRPPQMTAAKLRERRSSACS